MSILDTNDNCVTLEGLFNKVSQAYENAATVTVTITDSTGAVLVSALSMPYVTASNGDYRVVVPAATDLGDNGSIVTVAVTATTGSGSVYNATGSVYVYNRQLAGTA